MDAELVVRAQRGDAGAFAVVAGEIADRSLAVARRILVDPGLAEDATQRALLMVWQDLPQLRDVERFESWAYRVLLRACYTEIRNQRDWALNVPLAPGHEPHTDHDVGSIANRDQLERGLRRLSGDHRSVVVLRFFLDLPVERVAEVLGIPVGTAGSRLHHAIRALRAALEADLRPAGMEVVR
jgi:RNA polymerase sigma-70 factor (ECF subfamily)